MWEKLNDGDKIWWWSSPDVGTMIFSFDRKKKFNMWTDYPHKLTVEEKAMFDAENPYWVDWLSKRDGCEYRNKN